MEIVWLLIGLILGAAVGALWMFMRQSQQQQQSVADISRLQAELEAGKTLLTRMDTQLTQRQEFEQVASAVLARQSRDLAATNASELDRLLLPLRDKLTDFERKISETYQRESNERFALKSEIARLAEFSTRLSSDAENLTRALRGDNKMQGNWGEMVLARVLETCGLRPDIEYRTQASFATDEGRRLQPDVLVLLPDEKHLVVDAKVSLVAYEQALSAETPEAQQQALRRHADSLQAHIKGLSEKHYAALAAVNSPEVVLLFIPIEGAFSAAVQHRPELLAFAWERNIALVSPTTLFATLRTVSSVWKVERQNQHALEIARQGGVLYDRFAAFVEELEKIGRQLDGLTATYGDAMRRLRDGRDNLLSQAKRLTELGVSTKKK